MENRAWERVKSKDATFGEKAAAWVVTTAMKAKQKMGAGTKKRMRSRKSKSSNKFGGKIGAGVKKRRRSRKSKRPCKFGGKLSFRQHILHPVLKALTEIANDKTGSGLTDRKNLRQISLKALKFARSAVRKAGGRKRIRIPRIIPFETKVGGFLPLIPLFAGLSALGSLAGGASAIAKTVIDAKNAKKKLEEDRRHNTAMETIGSGLYLKKSCKGGFGLFLKKQKNYQ